MTLSSNQENKNNRMSGGDVGDSNGSGNGASPASLSPEYPLAGDRSFETQTKDGQPQNQSEDTRLAHAGSLHERGEGEKPVSPSSQEASRGQAYPPIPKQVQPASSNPVTSQNGAVQPQKVREEKGVAVADEVATHRVMLQEKEIRKALVDDFADFERSKEVEAKQRMKSSPAQDTPQEPSLTENVILYRGQHFYVRTTVSPEKKRKAHPLRKPTGHTAMIPKVIPNQRERVALRDTHLMPALDVVDFTSQKQHFYLPAWFEIAYVMLIVICSVIAHAYNMFNYPLYEMDEGTYMSAAWAVLNGKIYPYPYGYGHPPFAWMQIAALVQFMGGLFLFGNAINTGRVLMLLYTAGSTLLMYLIARKMSDSRAMAVLATVLFAFSPLAVTYQRLVMLDNIATFWLLLSLYLLVISRSKLRYTILSAVCLALAALSKEVLIFFVPPMVYGAWLYTTKFQRKFALVAFIYTFGAIASLWVLMAVLKGELFPQGWLPWDKHQHLSFIGTFLAQTQRGQNQGSFFTGWQAWYGTDPLFMILGLVAMTFNVVVGWWRRNHLFLALLAISYWLLLIRGGVVFGFYFIPLIPVMALNSAMMVHTVADWLGGFVHLDMFRAFLVFSVLGGVIFFFAANSQLVYHDDVTSVQTQAMNWVNENIPRDSYVIMNSYMYTDLRVAGGAAVGSGSVFPNAEVYINIATDPKMIAEVGANWDRVDYIVADSQIEQYITSKQLPAEAMFMRQALYAAGYPNSPCAVFKSPGYEMHVWCVKHQNPRPVASSAPSGVPPLLAQAILPVEQRLLQG